MATKTQAEIDADQYRVLRDSAEKSLAHYSAKVAEAEKRVARERNLSVGLLNARDDEGTANARLIAAAPELLDCLKKLRDRVRDNGRLVGWNSSDLDYIESVIAKAEGRP